MNSEQFQAEIDYAAAMLLSREMLQAGIISAQDFARMERLYREKHSPALPIELAVKKPAIP